jgi:hypothetical protein
MKTLLSRVEVVYQFKKQLIAHYDNNPLNLLSCFFMYLGFLVKFAHQDLVEFTKWQIADMCMAIYNPKIDVRLVALEVAWLYTRRGGKTRGLSILAVFFALLGYDVAWRAPHGEQLKKAGQWFLMNPFTEKIMIRSENVVRIIGSPDISIAPMTTGRVAGGDCDVLILDEGGWILKRLQAYIMYLTCRPMVSTSKFKHIINASTPARDTAFEDEFKSISKLEIKLKIKLTSIHDCEDCSWITPEWIASEREKYPEWYILLNYYCKWTVPYGAVFEKIWEVSDPKSPINAKQLSRVVATHAGVDHNGGDRNNPHYLVTGTFDMEFFYVLDEYKFTDLNFLFDPRFRGLSFEIEDGGFNMQWVDQEIRMGFVAIYFGWTKEEKMGRVQELRNRYIVIDKQRAPDTYTNFLNAGYSKTSRLVELEKRTDQHGMDCSLHLFHPANANFQVYGKTQHAPIQRRIGSGNRTLRV